jgi:excisionase family DNA binding protein
MTTRQPPRKPRNGSTPTVAAFVPPQARAPESGPAAERLAYSVDEAARLTGLSRDLLYDEMRRGHLDYIKVGRRRLLTRQHLEQFLGITPRSRPSPAGSTGSDPKAAGRAP